MKKKIGLFFGSFNPVHVGHLIIAQHVINVTDLAEVWMVVSPHNPHKQKSSLLSHYDRLHLVRLATEDSPNIKASDIEFGLPQPSYTIDTLTYLTEKYTDREFSLIMGGDNLATLHKWKNHDRLLLDHDLYIYRRASSNDGSVTDVGRIHFLDAPLMDISSSLIRNLIKSGKSVRYLLTDKVWMHLDATNWYR